jgi:hypothetical protein
MSDTLNVSLTLSRSPTINFNRSCSLTVALAADEMQHTVSDIGTTEEAIPLGDVATPGYSFFQNLDATNYVEIGIVVSTVFYPVLKLLPGEAQCFRFSTNPPYAKAHTASVKLESWINAA